MRNVAHAAQFVLARLVCDLRLMVLALFLILAIVVTVSKRLQASSPPITGSFVLCVTDESCPFLFGRELWFEVKCELNGHVSTVRYPTSEFCSSTNSRVRFIDEETARTIVQITAPPEATIEVVVWLKRLDTSRLTDTAYLDALNMNVPIAFFTANESQDFMDGVLPAERLSELKTADDFLCEITLAADLLNKANQ